MVLSGSPATLEAPVGRPPKKTGRAGGGKPSGDRPERARDKGIVTPLGVEVLTSLYDTLERCRRAKKWSKRSAVEEALRLWLTTEGYPPPAAPDA